MGQEAPKASDLLWLIGPPLQGSFKILLDGSGLDAHEAIKVFVSALDREVFLKI